MKVQDHSLMDPDIQETPFAYYDALLEQAPVYFMPEIQAYVISKYKDIQYVVAHPEIWSIDMRSLPAAQLIKHRAAQEILGYGIGVRVFRSANEIKVDLHSGGISTVLALRHSRSKSKYSRDLGEKTWISKSP